MICLHCGKEVPDQSAFCMACGRPIALSAKRARLRIWIAAVVSAVLLVALVVVLIFVSGQR